MGIKNNELLEIEYLGGSPSKTLLERWAKRNEQQATAGNLGKYLAELQINNALLILQGANPTVPDSVMHLEANLRRSVYAMLSAGSSIGHDWRGIADLMRCFQRHELDELGRTERNPAQPLFEQWAKRRPLEATVTNLCNMLAKLQINNVRNMLKCPATTSFETTTSTPVRMSAPAPQPRARPVETTSPSVLDMSPRSFAIVCALLDKPEPGRDWKEVIKSIPVIRENDLIILRSSRNPTQGILNMWHQRDPEGATVDALIAILRKLPEREELIEMLRKG
jgi:hypothetical protein